MLRRRLFFWPFFPLRFPSSVFLVTLSLSLSLLHRPLPTPAPRTGYPRAPSCTHSWVHPEKGNLLEVLFFVKMLLFSLPFVLEHFAESSTVSFFLLGSSLLLPLKHVKYMLYVLYSVSKKKEEKRMIRWCLNSKLCWLIRTDADQF